MNPATIIHDANMQMDAIRNDPATTVNHKRNLLARVFVQATATLDELRTGSKKSDDDRADALSKALFGLRPGADPTAVISYRDAQDRAASIDDEQDAIKLIKRATTAGDDVLAQAVANAAMDNWWVDALNEYELAVGPTKVAQLEELWDLRCAASSTSIKNKMQSAAEYYFSAPNELTGLNTSTLEAMAQRAGSTQPTIQ